MKAALTKLKRELLEEGSHRFLQSFERYQASQARRIIHDTSQLLA